MDPADLERLIDRELDALPAPRAPRTLLPRVMAAIDARAFLPWHARGWFAWPLALRLLSAVVFVSSVLAVAWLPELGAAIAAGSDLGGRLPPIVGETVRELSRIWTTAGVLWRTVIAPVATGLTLFVMLMSVACVAFGTALNRVALGGASDV
jgi:hypothetical protein